ncbi:uncharacterized protein P174DRAFT_17572 [Aspergillus novofumigatus IBT 16806]|uniref:Uncharacterized protein n=1 Tax=Aspergillus novofumigatus (strain IBT 16806) TaxID=1392255 RepID=A0A2I1CLD9_ASPN1|nr:uncharacterized protein P174DRAFT_17572 [Aspergillus novofumigatus IBT 16806]PKX98438.1 hypothetical protein P174DRAFT_17572 [Aspergillus novofumigatus IBT 16806]
MNDAHELSHSLRLRLRVIWRDVKKKENFECLSHLIFDALGLDFEVTMRSAVGIAWYYKYKEVLNAGP